ncbi:hypothetical protein PFAG_02256 [Plasmodium falciparum Santa Lucia]|uniref:Uncharacterized protein n=9 Tax=Plasmodium falciparum TaxID=5833 RepID=A0A024W8U1_PLAFA|nr:hypothetical protein PFFVO_02309 [Plasmodium falciparum Vietnam Oak-Knoll (FVO)]ETW30975.1 hypothetical protein PFFCH_01590 [Plasmodium falciparum FCH/4]ETW36900.1 hypothetical protein PFTANZ_02380 [Plasmodium falciparum Tanzania (2000708)]ETW42957.1 hypothetical protein PFNF135_02432 [Plasmodium falciparum NF135/5.C10]ETW56895.1 hypothetical protein PFUGPA_01096 [Plasmodium falciparum Palo Alto/Uganda]ETW61802.1 hypothetical protein PFMC_02271 [Plasmodium falciparum CAMP/Malaysia]EUR72647
MIIKRNNSIKMLHSIFSCISSIQILSFFVKHYIYSNISYIIFPNASLYTYENFPHNHISKMYIIIN